MNETHPTMERVFEKTGLGSSALALRINVSPQTITNWSKRGISKTGAMAVAQEFDCSVDWILRGDKQRYLDTVMRVTDVSEVYDDPAAAKDVDMFHYLVPLFDWDFETTWRFDDISEFVMRPSNAPEWSVCLVIQNQSMAPEFNPDDMIFVDVKISIEELKDSDFIVVRKHGASEAILRQLLIGDSASEKYIRPYNPNWVDQKIIRLDDDYEIIGKVVAKLITYD